MSTYYKRERTERSYAVGFGATSVPLIAWGLWIDDDDPVGLPELEQLPVVGFLIEHDVDRDGQVWQAQARPAVYSIEYGEAVSAALAFGEPENGALIGVYPPGQEPPQHDIDRAVSTAQGKMAHGRARRAAAQR